MNDDPKLGRSVSRPPWIRSGSVFVRAAHLLAASAVLGAILWKVEAPGVHSWWLVAGASGVLMLVTEYVQHPDLHSLVAGWATLVKLILIACIFLLPSGAPWLMSAAFVVAVVFAHAPRGWRHRRLF